MKNRFSKSMVIGGVLVVVLVLSIFAVGSLSAKTPKTPLLLLSPGSIAIDNTIIDIDMFGETDSGYDVWLYQGGSNAYYEAPLMGYGPNLPVYLSDGTVVQAYPATGFPDTWYDAIIDLDLDGDGFADVRVTRSIKVPAGQKFFYVKYVVENIKGSNVFSFKLFQGVDYDAGDAGTDDEGGYDGGGFVWTHDLDDGFDTWVGFIGNKPLAHHSVDYYSNMWDQLEAGSLNDANYYSTDVGVGLEWHFGTLGAGSSVSLEVTFAFADSFAELSSLLVPAPLNITTTSLPNGTVGTAYNQTLSATGGVTPYFWAIIAGILPGGLTLDPSTGVISGTPTTVETQAFTVEVTDSGVPPDTDTQGLSITVTAVPPPPVPLFGPISAMLLAILMALAAIIYLRRRARAAH